MLTREQVISVYRQILERDPREDEIEAQLEASPDLETLLRIALDSEEHAERLRQHGIRSSRAPAVVNIYHPELAEWGPRPGTRSADEVAIVGHEGWLFLCGGTNANLDQHLGEVEPAPDWLASWRTTIERRAVQAEEVGLTTALIAVPDKLAVYGEHYPEELNPRGKRPIELLLADGLPFVYPVSELRAAAAAGRDVYQRTDTHLTFHGNEILTASLLTALGIDNRPDLGALPLHTYPVTGDLGARFDPPLVSIIGEPGSLNGARIVEDNRGEIAAVDGHLGTRRVFRNETAPDPRVVVLFGDSFGFAGPDYQGMTWFLAQIFTEVHFVWVPFGWDPNYVRKAQASVVVFQGAERFLGRVPPQESDVWALAAETLRRERPASMPRRVVNRASRLIRRS